MIIAKCNKFKIPIERVEKLHGKVKSWQIEDLVKLSGLIKGIESGQASAEDQFPADKVDEMADRVTKAKAGKQGTQTPAQQEEVAQPQSNEAKAASESPTPEQLESVNYWIKKIEDAPDSFELKILQKELQVFGGDDEKRLLAVYNVMRTKFGMGKPLESFS